MKKVLVLFNNLEEADEYLALRDIDPSTLDFEPKYRIAVATAQEEYDAIVDALRAEGFDAEGVNLKDDFDLLGRLLTQEPPDVVFNLVEFFHNDLNHEGAVAGMYDLAGVPYTGATPFCLSLCRRKDLTKRIFLQSGVPTPRFLTVKGGDVPPGHGLDYPLIVKPSRGDGSAGVEPHTVVYDYAQLKKRLAQAGEEFQCSMLVEEFLAGRELHISVFGDNPPEALPIIDFNFSELPAGHPPLLTYDIKWNPLAPAYHKVHSICPAVLPPEVERRAKELAVRAYQATCCRDYARIDLRLGADDVPYVLEVNPNPDLTAGVSFMDSAEQAGYGFSEMLKKIVGFALERGA
ncbi:MAG: D-alanine--D-alanine ligase [Acidobacteriota bacterium]|jgi:D-alanine-D-alanine ligase|nr:D-alanine--D-alanine ligase [Acidobacteriota bacterium]